MPIVSKVNFTVNSSVASCGDSDPTIASDNASKAHVSPIAILRGHERPLLTSKQGSRFKGFCPAVETTGIEHGNSEGKEDVSSAPDSTNSFLGFLEGEEERIQSAPAAETEFQDVISPAQMFLSMFTPVSKPSVSPDAEGQYVAGYILGSTIGHGGFATIKKAHSSNGSIVAVKILRLVDIERQGNSEEVRRQLDNELAIWSSLNHEHIMPLFSHVHTSFAHFFVTLFCPAGSLFDILKRDGHPSLPQEDAGMMFRQVVRGVRYLHEVARVVHRDIKLENVLVDESGVCRIGDFGLAKHMQNTSGQECECNLDNAEFEVERSSDRIRRHTTTAHTNQELSLHMSLRRFRGPSKYRSSLPHGQTSGQPSILPFHHFQPGSLPYASPELLSPPSITCKNHTLDSNPSPAQDMWALGVLLYALLSGRLPFWDTFEPRLQMKILHGAYDFPVGIGHGAERVLRGCLEHSVLDRWTIDMVDDIAWGVGWGLEADISSADSSTFIGDDIFVKFQHGGHDFRKSRSRSRVRPYPEYMHTSALEDNIQIPDAASIISTSRSRSRSKVDPATERTTILRSTSTDDSVPSPRTHSHPTLVSRGRRMRKSLSGGTSIISKSMSHSLSHSRSASPETPVDVDIRRFHFDHASADSVRSRYESQTSLKDGTKLDGLRTAGTNLNIFEGG